jgi:hypothetical protein
MFSDYKKKVIVGGALAATASLGVQARGPKAIEHDVNGNELRLVELSHSPSFLTNLETGEA